MKNKEMSIWEHLGELRKRLVLSVLAVLIIGSFCYIYWEFLLKILVQPVGNRQLIYLNIMEPFIARFKLAMWAGFLIAFPFVLYQILVFVVPGLTKKEKSFLIIMVFLMVVLFYSGVLFGYKYVLKTGITWLEAQGSGIVKANLTVSEYISFVSLFLLAFGISFETPAIILLLTRINLIRPIDLIKQWRIVITFILIFSAIITPDWSPITMFLMAIPMLFLYILGVGLSWIFAPRKKKATRNAQIAQT